MGANTLDKAKAVERVLAGESTSVIAPDYGVTPQTIRAWVLAAGRAMPGARAPRKHVLANVDREAMTADCAACGPVRIKRKQGDRVQCATAESQWGRFTPPPTGTVVVTSDGRLKMSAETRAVILEKAGGVCGICERPLDVETMRADHDHGTGAVRGALCTRCNTGLGKFADDPDLLRRAADYIESARSRDSLVTLARSA